MDAKYGEVRAVFKIYRYGTFGKESKVVADHLGRSVDHFADVKSKLCRGSRNGPADSKPGLFRVCTVKKCLFLSQRSKVA